MGQAIWTGVVAIYGPLIVSIICIIITGIRQRRRQDAGVPATMRRPGVIDRTVIGATFVQSTRPRDITDNRDVSATNVR